MRVERTTIRAWAIFGAAALTTVTAAPSFAAPTKASRAMPGADRDRHSCIGSAGFTYSRIQQTCVRLFESAIRLDPPARRHGAPQKAVLSAFLLFHGDVGEGDAEIFLPGTKTSLILKQVPGENAGLWHAPGYKLSQWRGEYMLDDATGKSLYQGATVR